MKGCETINDYDRCAPRPKIGSVWWWEPHKPYARQQVWVDDVKWNGEQWWVKVNGYWNELSRFWEAVER